MSDRRALLRTLPAIDKLLATTLLTELAKTQPHLLIVAAAQQTVDDLRRQLLNEKSALPDLDLETVAAQVAARVAALARVQIVFQVRIAPGDITDGLQRIAAKRCPTEVGVQQRAGDIDHLAQ